MQEPLVAPHGGELVDLMVTAERGIELKAASTGWPSWSLTPRQTCDLELLLNGGFSPLRGFLCRADYESVVVRLRLVGGTLWPIPIVLDLPEDKASGLKLGSRLVLADAEGVMLAVMQVEDIWKPDRQAEVKAVYGTTDILHPGVRQLLEDTNPVYVGGRVEGVQQPVHYDFRTLRLTPAQLRREFERLGWHRVVGFQTRNPLHRAHFELTLRAAREAEANLLIQPVVGLTKPGDLDHYTRVRCYQAVLQHYPAGMALLSLLPLAMRMAGPREAVWHAIIRKNYGCTHFIVGRDHAGPGNDRFGRPFYGPGDAQEVVRSYEHQLNMRMLTFQSMVFLEHQRRYVPENEVPPGEPFLRISGSELRQRLADGREVPAWYTFPEVAAELRCRHPPRNQRGFTVFFTGLSGAGKSTIANVLLVKFLEMGGRPVTFLDGDIVRKHLSSELGFSKEHRDINIWRIGFVAAEITKNGGIAICAPIAPYEKTRREVRSAIEAVGGFVLVHVATPIGVCEERDRKGLYVKARAGLIPAFTGVSDPYEPPSDAELVLNTAELTPEQAAQRILLHLEKDGYIGTRSTV